MSRPMPTALVAEDEAPQRLALCQALAQAWPQLQIVASCEDGRSALAALERHAPDVAFLDIRMPGASGLEVARVASQRGTLVVFTTAYDAHAVAAFETGAVDYLLKPVQPARLAQALVRVRERLAAGRAAVEIGEVLAQLDARLGQAAPPPIRWISASAGDSVRLYDIDQVLYFQAQDKHVRVVTAEQEAIIRTPLKELLAGLDPQVFWQVHRGVVVRVAAIERVHKDALGRQVLVLRQRSERLPVSAAYAGRFRGM